MGILIALVLAAVAIAVAAGVRNRSRDVVHETDLHGRPDFTELRAAVVDWTSVKTACLDHDIERIQATGAFVPRLPESLAERSAESSRVVHRLATRLTAGEARDGITRMSARADEIFNEEALNPHIVTERWLVDRIAEIRELSRQAESALST